jgi:hypothetical protein
MHHTDWVMCFSLAIGAIPEAPPQADLQIGAIKIIPVLALLSPACNYNPVLIHSGIALQGMLP